MDFQAWWDLLTRIIGTGLADPMADRELARRRYWRQMEGDVFIPADVAENPDIWDQYWWARKAPFYAVPPDAPPPARGFYRNLDDQDIEGITPWPGRY